MKLQLEGNLEISTPQAMRNSARKEVFPYNLSPYFAYGLRFSNNLIRVFDKIDNLLSEQDKTDRDI